MSFKFFFMIIILIAMALAMFIKESLAQSTTFQKHLITANFPEGTEVFAGDINKDGFMDFIAAGRGDGGQVDYYENNGYHEFIAHHVDSGMQGTRSVCAADLNDDGEIDILAAAWEGNSINWYENDGNENWTKHVVDDNFIGAHTVDIKDVNQDGKPDILCSSFDNSAAYSEIAWWENNMPDTVWTKHVISTRFKQSPFIYGEDMDGDTDMDILACGELLGEVYWWENDGNQNWTEHMIDDQFSMAHTVFIRDIDLDGDMDVIGAACMSSTIAWWENDGNQQFTKNPMGSLAGALWFDGVDLDNDGDRDLYGGGQGANKLVWWENDGNTNFSRYNFDDTFTQTFSVVHADFDNDSDTDLVAIGYNSGQISWFENKHLQPNLYNKPECVVYDSFLDRYLVSNPGGGFIVETDTANNQSYFTHGYDIPCGMCIVDGVLYASDGDTLYGWHLGTGNEVFKLYMNAYNNLDGMCTDGDGFLYVIDTQGRIFKVNLDAGTFEVLVSSGLPNWPQDCVYDPFENRIVVAAYAVNAPIVGVDPESGEVTTLTTNSVGRFDGITIDQFGNFYLASHNGNGQVYKYPHDFSDKLLLGYGYGEPTGLYYNQEDNILAVPSFDQHTVYFIPINPVGLEDRGMKDNIEFDVYPNPCEGTLYLRYSISDIRYPIFEAFDMSGGKVKSIELQRSETQAIDVSDLPKGVYLVKLQAGKAAGLRKIIIQ